MAVTYKFECYWSQDDGWHFSFGNWRMWEIHQRGYMVAELVNVDGVGTYQNHKAFDDMETAINYMRTA